MMHTRKGFGLQKQPRKAMGIETKDRRTNEEITADILKLSRKIRHSGEIGVIAYNAKDKHVWWAAGPKDFQSQGWLSSEAEVEELFKSILEIEQVTIKQGEIPRHAEYFDRLADGWVGLVPPKDPDPESLAGRVREQLVPTLKQLQRFGVGGYSHFIPFCLYSKDSGELIILVENSPESAAISGAERFEKGLNEVFPALQVAIEEVKTVKLEDWQNYATESAPSDYIVLDPRLVTNF